MMGEVSKYWDKTTLMRHNGVDRVSADDLKTLPVDRLWMAGCCYSNQWPWLCCHTPYSWLGGRDFGKIQG